MKDFQSVFDNAGEVDDEFDAMFGGEEDGSLIDNVCGFNEAGECETDFDELHQTQGDADPDDIANDLRVDDETDNAPKGAEGSDSDPVIDLAMGECGEFSDTGVKGSTEADDFYKDYNEPEDTSALTGEGPDVKMDNEDIEGEADKIIEAACGSTKECSTKEGGETSDDDNDIDVNDDMDSVMGSIDDDDQTPVGESGNGYEEGDSDLIDLVSGDDD
jgi:hypothetical protein